EPLDAFLSRYGPEADRLAPHIRAFPPEALRAWCAGLGVETFVGTSGRVFPREMKASPLLRAWRARLDALGVVFRLRTRWTGWTGDGALALDSGPPLAADAVVLACGGASWPRLGSDGAWTGLLDDVAPLVPANCGFRVAWSPAFAARWAGAPLKGAAFGFGGRRLKGEATATAQGIEGGAIYALSRALREAVEAEGRATLAVDLKPDTGADALAAKLARGAPGLSTANRLRRVGLSPLAAALAREAGPLPRDPAALAARLKAVAITLDGPTGMARAISSAGGLRWSAVDDRLMLRARPGVFAAGEMLDWEAPTGGYLLQACFATGRAAALGALARLGAD
ncbi:MAG: TIGR03862 family flavoprotein, partial [Rhodobacteraceae bacterium]